MYDRTNLKRKSGKEPVVPRENRKDPVVSRKHGTRRVDRVRGGVVLGAALLLAGCGGGGLSIPQGSGGGPFARASDGPQTVSIHVRNLNFNEAELWAVRRGDRQKLGIINGKADTVYRIPWTISEPLQLQIDLLAGPRCTTDALQVDPGDILEVEIAVDFRNQPNCR